eukprot:CAMPEP_0174737948 /NCGR_PEP_ID=MMETSP1094-20130205/69102_1 /TAXON_ID=156173 /ORGANISM="Chrysochromulina brevifilum, Strain UTEX LB 985" /LENGTH=226 /DNA_ID=CAMNT_0015941265 /DNA_START=95 /DNA_END=772 /DNA_ORIENTATION=-
MIVAVVLGVIASAGAECPPGFERFERSCYAFAQGPSTHGAAIEICESLGSKLACPSNEREIQYLNARAANDGHDYWIGLNDIIQEGHWRWPGLCSRMMQANFNLTYPWCPGEPNNGGGHSGADCVRVVGTMPPDDSHAHPQQCWADYQCDLSMGDHGANNEFGFVCELNFDKFGDEDAYAKLYGFGDDDDDDDEQEGKGDGNEDDRHGCGGSEGNPAAVAFAVIFA